MWIFQTEGERAEFWRTSCAFIPFPEKFADKLPTLSFGDGDGQPLAEPCSGAESQCRKPTLPRWRRMARRPLPGFRLTWSIDQAWLEEGLSKDLINKFPPASSDIIPIHPHLWGGLLREWYQERGDISPCHMPFAICMEILACLLIFQIGHHQSPWELGWIVSAWHCSHSVLTPLYCQGEARDASPTTYLSPVVPGGALMWSPWWTLEEEATVLEEW